MQASTSATDRQTDSWTTCMWVRAAKYEDGSGDHRRPEEGEVRSVISNQIKSLFESGKSPYTQTHTRIHKTQYTIKEETIKL